MSNATGLQQACAAINFLRSRFPSVLLRGPARTQNSCSHIGIILHPTRLQATLFTLPLARAAASKIFPAAVFLLENRHRARGRGRALRTCPHGRHHHFNSLGIRQNTYVQHGSRLIHHDHRTLFRFLHDAIATSGHNWGDRSFLQEHRAHSCRDQRSSTSSICPRKRRSAP